MNFKKTWKRFFSLSRRSDGFTLVELIVVIAILAILAGVGVPAYNGYIKKANMGADQTLAGEVAHALQLYYYSHPMDDVRGYVTITKDGTTASSEDMKAAMAAVFGADWEQDTNLRLKADWSEATGNSMLGYAIDHADEAPTVAGSTFLTAASTDGMLNALTSITGIASNVIKGHEDNAVKILNNMGLTDVANKMTALEADGLKKSDEGYASAISNLLVGYFSGNMNAENINKTDSLEELAMSYATFYAYTESIGKTSAMDQVNDKLATTTDIGELTAEKLFTGIFETDPTLYQGYVGYMEEKGDNDQTAFLSMMGAMNQVSNGFTGKETLTNPGLYNSDSVKAQVNEYVNAVKIVNGMDEAELNAMKASVGSGNVVVTIAAGVPAISPAMF